MEPMSGHLDRVAAATKVFTKAEAALDRARAELHAAILAATEAGEKQVDITDVSPYRREQVRRIVDARRRLPASDT